MHAEKCPVCFGRGKVSYDSATEKLTCHGCDGKGWVVVPDAGSPAEEGWRPMDGPVPDIVSIPSVFGAR